MGGLPPSWLPCNLPGANDLGWKRLRQAFRIRNVNRTCLVSRLTRNAFLPVRGRVSRRQTLDFDPATMDSNTDAQLRQQEWEVLEVMVLSSLRSTPLIKRE